MGPRGLVATSLLSCLCIGLCTLITGCDAETNDAEAAPAVTRPGVDPYCDTRPQFDFCEDFDTRALPGVFDEQRVENGSLIIDTETASSAPSSLKATVDEGGKAYLQHSFSPGGKLRLFGFVYVSELGDGEVEVGAFARGDYRISFGVSADGGVWAQSGEVRTEGDGVVPLDRWATFRWDVNLDEDGTGSATLRFGNDFFINTDMLTPPASGTNPIIATVGLSAATGAWTVRFDNLTVEVGELNR